jgi:hypothetical protein
MRSLVFLALSLLLGDRSAGHEFASGIGREKRKPIRPLVELGLSAKK